MGKTHEALERYRKEKFAESMGSKLASRDLRTEDSSIPALSKMGSIRSRDLMRTISPGEQVSQNEKSFLRWLSAEHESERDDSGRLNNLPLKAGNRGHKYKPQLKISLKTQGNPNWIFVNKNPFSLMDRFELYKLKNLFAKQIVLNLKSGVIQSIIKNKYFLVLHDYLKYTCGELLKFKTGCFYRLNFKSKAMLPILLNRTGCLVNFLLSNKKLVACRNKQVVPANIMNTDEVKQLELMLVRNIFSAADLKAIRKTLTASFDITFYDEIECRDGNITVLDGEVAYELLLDLRLGFSIFMDKYGNFLDVSAVDDLNVWEEVIRDHSLHQNWLPPINLFKNGQSNISTV